MTPQKTILKLIRQHRKFLIATHVNPDLDAISSELALAQYLKACGKQVAIVHENPVTKAFDFVQGVRSIKTLKAFRGDYDVAFVVDCGDLKRVGNVQKILIPGKPIINIDHHFTSEPFATVNIVDPSASSTTEIIFSLLQDWNARITKTTANYLYLGILTDTGSFRYQNTTSKAHRIAAQLIDCGVVPSQIYRHVYEDLQPTHLDLLIKIVQKARYYRQGRVVCVSLPRSIFKRAGTEFDIKDKTFLTLRMLQNVEVIVIFVQESEKRTRVNFRSTGRVDVSAIAQEFSGGGHKAASGCYVDCSLEKAKQAILPQILKKV